MTIRLPNVVPDYFPLGGGLDLMTPAISKKPGRCIDAQNYEPEISGGYRRINGYERYDGHASPTDTSYWVLPVAVTGTITVGATITGTVSGATGKVLLVDDSNVIAGRVSGSFTSTEGLTISGVPVGTMSGTVYENGADQASDHADYKLLAADDQRLNISAVPGSGRIRGVWVYNDTVYAFRDNAGGTACVMHKATASGWSAVSLGVELQFTTGTAAVSEGQTVTGATSGAAGVVTRVVLRSGSYGSGNAVGSFIFATTTGTFQNGENLQVAGLTKAVASGASAAITLLPGGRYEFCNANFTGSTNTERMYGCDGVNKAFEFDGTVFVPIRTGMTADTPAHIIEHKNHLFLSFRGSVQFSAIGNPYAFTVVLGAGELTTGADVSGFVPQSGNESGAAMAVFTAKKTFILYGSSSANFNLVQSKDNVGFSAYTMQSVGNNVYGMTAAGIQSLIATQNYGNFSYASLSFLIQPYIRRKQGLEIASTVLQDKSQYRVYFSDNTGLAVGLTGDKVSGIMPLDYGMPVRCTCTAKLTTGDEVTYFGSDDGYVYRDSVGTSFDGSAIAAWFRLAFNHNKSPRMLKSYQSAVLELDVEEYARVNVSYDLGYGTSDVEASAASEDQILLGGGGYWDGITWEEFNWDAQAVLDPTIPLDGTETNLSLLFYSERAQDKPHTIQGVTEFFTPRRLKR